VASLSNQALPNEIVQLEAEMLANSHEAASALASAYDSGEVTAVAQANRRDRRSTSATPTQAQIAAVAQVVARISGVPVGQTIGTLASIASNPFVAAAIIEVAAATATPGGVAAVASNSGGLSLAAQTLISSAGTTAPTGIAEAVTQAATTSNGSTTTSGSSCTSC
jgi:hypothetical protein